MDLSPSSSITRQNLSPSPPPPLPPQLSTNTYTLNTTTATNPTTSNHQPPTESYHRVYILSCAHCGCFVSDRGMKAVLLLRPSVTLFSTDGMPYNCGPLYPDGSDGIVYSEHVERTCDCLTQSIGCFGCGNTIGYHIICPCSRCVDSVSKHRRAANGHRWVFHYGEVNFEERCYVANEPGIINSKQAINTRSSSSILNPTILQESIHSRWNLPRSIINQNTPSIGPSSTSRNSNLTSSSSLTHHQPHHHSNGRLPDSNLNLIVDRHPSFDFLSRDDEQDLDLAKLDQNDQDESIEILSHPTDQPPRLQEYDGLPPRELQYLHSSFNIPNHLISRRSRQSKNSSKHQPNKFNLKPGDPVYWHHLLSTGERPSPFFPTPAPIRSRPAR